MAPKNISDEDAMLISSRQPEVATVAIMVPLIFGKILCMEIMSMCGGNESIVTEILMCVLDEGTFPKTENEAMISNQCAERMR